MGTAEGGESASTSHMVFQGGNSNSTVSITMGGPLTGSDSRSKKPAGTYGGNTI